MSTPNVQRDPIDAGGFPSETTLPANPNEQVGGNSGELQPRDGYFWLNRAFYIIGAVAGVGFLIVMLGAYAIQDDATLIAGTTVIVLAVVAWIITTIVMVAMMSKYVGRILRRILWPHRTKRER